MAISSSALQTSITVVPKEHTVALAPVENTVSLVNSNISVTASTTAMSVTPIVQKVNIVTVGVQGPAGTGTGGVATEYAYREYAQVGNTYYKGWSDSNNTASSSWMILRGIEAPAGVFTETLADGNDNADNVWDNRVGISYA